MESHPLPIEALESLNNWCNTAGGGRLRNMKTRFTHSYADIISIENLLMAWREFSRGKGMKSDVANFSLNCMAHIIQLHTDLASGSYQHGPYESFSINDTKPRSIHKASVRDRLLHRALYRILYPSFDRTFIADSFSCREGKGTHKALNRFRSFAYEVSKNHTQTCWVLKCDIKKFFASIHHERLNTLLSKRIADERILGLCSNVIESFHTAPKRGLPLGNLTSQLFANVYLDPFDQWMKHTKKTHHYLRYADDFAILSFDREELTALIDPIRDFLSSTLALSIHEDKVSVKTFTSGVDFLGWVHFPDHRVLRSVTKRRMFTRLAQTSKEESLQSYLGLLSHGNTQKISHCIRHSMEVELTNPINLL